MNTLAVAPPNSCGGYIRYERLEDERQETKPFVLFQYVYLASVYREERICVTSKGLRDIGQLEGDDDHDDHGDDGTTRKTPCAGRRFKLGSNGCGTYSLNQVQSDANSTKRCRSAIHPLIDQKETM